MNVSVGREPENWEKSWQYLVSKIPAAEACHDLFKAYFQEIMDWNLKTNLTAKAGAPGIVNHLFIDSLTLSLQLDFNQLHHIVDVGSGAGIPGIPLKILFPHLKVTLLEVKGKKIEFLNYVIQKLGLTDIDVCCLDWRTFNRTQKQPVDLFVTKAAFGDEEIVRMFRNNCNYTEKCLVYWASNLWQPQEKNLPYIAEQLPYKVGKCSGQFVFFAKNTSWQGGYDRLLFLKNPD